MNLIRLYDFLFLLFFMVVFYFAASSFIKAILNTIIMYDSISGREEGVL